MHTSRRLGWLLGVGLLWATACGDDDSGEPKSDAATDAAAHDATVRDASSSDGGGADSGVRADGGTDAGGMDAGAMDAAAPDTGVDAAAAPDSGSIDAQIDSSAPEGDGGDAAIDAANADADGADAESADAGTDGGESDAATDASTSDAGDAGERPYLQSGFEAVSEGDEGWEITGNAAAGETEPVYMPTGGNPDGFISAEDGSADTWYFSAPEWYLGNRADLIGKILSFELKTTAAITTPFSAPDVVLVGGNVTLVYDLSPDPGTNWTNYDVTLSATGWTVGTLTGVAATAEQLQTVLSNLTALQIRGEFDQAAGDSTSLDNVEFGIN